MNFFSNIYLFLFAFLFLFQACTQEDESNPILENKNNFTSNSKLFEFMPVSQTGVSVRNVVKESAQNNFLNNNLLYSGAGTAIGDLNNDGLPDMVIARNTEKPTIYINKGNFKFEALGDETGLIKMDGWTSGANIADVNGDGKLDIYFSRGGTTIKDASKRTNLLYINKGNLKFEESAAKYGLADEGASIQSAFFDYDLDGDLDVYVLNYLPGTQQVPFGQLKKFRNNPDPNYLKHYSDHLYRNDGNTFTDVSVQSGIANWAHGLGIAIGDVNKDNYPDIFIANDFEVDDFYYENNGDGTFTEKIKEKFGHVSFFAMGVDMADVNNDSYLDIFEVEMLPKDRERSVMNMQQMDRGRFEDLLKIGMNNQYMRNCLHINRGNGHFSDVAQIAGINKTDWSWGTLLLDLDDDGLKDIFVTNGILRDMKNRDFQHNGNKLAEKTGGKLTLEQMHDLVPTTKIRNYVYKNKADFSFEDVSESWGFGIKGFSNAISHADFDMDGDLDLVINNLNDPPYIYKNLSAEKGQNNLNIVLKGNKNNFQGIGSKVKIKTKQGIQYQELFPTRGFQSSSEAKIHFGLGKEKLVEEVTITWPDGKSQVLTNVKANKVLNLSYKDAKQLNLNEKAETPLFVEQSSKAGIDFKHKETYFDDYGKEILLPHKMSQNGPFLAIGDIDMDGNEDFYIGGAKGQAGAIYLQNNARQFTKGNGNAFALDAKFEDLGANFFDADGDKDLDLYVVSGSNEFQNDGNQYQDRLYINNGKGIFTKSNALPKIESSGSCIIPEDFDQDGDIDLFVGGRVLPQKYPNAPESMLLINQGGKFVNATNKIAPELSKIGMVTDATWSDYDKDGDKDLIVVGEWMTISVLENDSKKLNLKNVKGLEVTSGWWSSIEAVDLDADGDEDYIVGNIGLNHKFKATEDKPFHIYCEDFDNTGSLDIVLAFHQEDKLYPVRGRDCSSEQMPFILDKFPSFEEFGKADVNEVYGEKLEKALHKEANMFASIILVNKGGSFEIKQLPTEAQLSSINGSITKDFTGDGLLDILIAGNMFETEAETSRADASIGLLLKNEGDFTFKSVNVSKTGFFAPGDVKDIKMAKAKDGSVNILVANNNGPLESFYFSNPIQ